MKKKIGSCDDMSFRRELHLTLAQSPLMFHEIADIDDYFDEMNCILIMHYWFLNFVFDY